MRSSFGFALLAFLFVAAARAFYSEASGCAPRGW